MTKKKAQHKCTLQEFCDDARMFHTESGYHGLVIVNTVNLKTGKRGRRMGYIERRGGPTNFFAACPWCGVSQKKPRKSK